MSKFRVMVDETENGALALMPMMDGGIVYASNGEPLVLGIRDAVRFGKPIPLRGMLGFFEADIDLHEQYGPGEI